MEHTLDLEGLKNTTCRAFGGNNCVLHQCMFSCKLADSIKKSCKEKNLTKEETDKIIESIKRS